MSSTTMTMTMPVLPPPSLSAVPCCPNCGTDLSLTLAAPPPPPKDTNTDISTLAAAQAKIDNMHDQIRLLNAKATAAVDRWADYEDELATLRKELTTARARNNNNNTMNTTIKNNDADQDAHRRGSSTATATITTTAPQTPTFTTTTATSPSPTSPRAAGSSPGIGFAAAATNRISALLSRKSTPNLKALPTAPRYGPNNNTLLPTPPPSGGGAGGAVLGHHTSYSTGALLGPHPKSPLGGFMDTLTTTAPPPSTADLLDALTREQKLRLAAEAKVNDTSREVEELSVTLFEEANEMVATERRERARLEALVGELEKRDREKKLRLGRLEVAVERIERARSVLAERTAVAEEGATVETE